MPAATLDGDATAQRGAVSRLRRLAVRVAPFIRPAVAVAILAAIGYAVASLWSGSPGKPGIRDALSTLAWPSVVLAFGCILAGTFTSLMAWRTLLADEGHRLRIAPAAQIFLVGQLGKYLPGSVWAVVVQMELARRHRVPRSRAFTTSLIFVGLSLSTALVVGLMGLPVIAATNHPELWWLLAALPVLVVASLPPVLCRLVNLVLRVLRKPPMPAPLSWPGVGKACAWLVGTSVFFGLQLWLLANALGAPGWGGLVRSVGGFALAIAAGAIFILAPSGAGVREIIIVAALAPVMSSAEAFGVAVVSRVLFIVADVAAAGAGAISARRTLRRAAPAVEPRPADPATKARPADPAVEPGPADPVVEPRPADPAAQPRPADPAAETV